MPGEYPAYSGKRERSVRYKVNNRGDAALAPWSRVLADSQLALALQHRRRPSHSDVQTRSARRHRRTPRKVVTARLVAGSGSAVGWMSHRRSPHPPLVCRTPLPHLPRGTSPLARSIGMRRSPPRTVGSAEFMRTGSCAHSVFAIRPVPGGCVTCMTATVRVELAARTDFAPALDAAVTWPPRSPRAWVLIVPAATAPACGSRKDA